MIKLENETNLGNSPTPEVKTNSQMLHTKSQNFQNINPNKVDNLKHKKEH